MRLPFLNGELPSHLTTLAKTLTRNTAAVAFGYVSKRAESVLDSIADVYILFDRQWRYLYVNDAAVRGIGRPKEEILKMTLWQLYPDILGTDLERQYRRAMEERVSVSCEFCYAPRQTWWENRFSPVAEGLAVFATDITERKRAEADLRKQTEILQKIFDHLPVMINFVDERGRIVMVNRQWETTLGWTVEEIRSRDLDIFTECYPNEAERKEVLRFLAESQGEWRDFRPRLRSGEVIDTTWAIVHLSDGTSVGIGQDISDRKRAEDDLRASRERLRSLAAYLQSVREEERTSIARELHDEIGQVLTGLKLSLEMALLPSQDDGSLREALALTNELIGKVRELSLDLRPAMLDDLGLLAALRWHFEHFTRRAGLRVDFKHAGLEGRRFDREIETAAYRIVQEALTNVARHAGIGDVQVRVRADDVTLTVRVTDRGIGFDPSARSAPTGGLPGMHERAAILGGYLEVRSSPGGGTTLMAELPLGHTATTTPIRDNGRQ